MKHPVRMSCMLILRLHGSVWQQTNLDALLHALSVGSLLQVPKRTPEICLQPQNCRLYGASLWLWKLHALAGLLRLSYIPQSQILLLTTAFQACNQWECSFSPFHRKRWSQVFQAHNCSPRGSATCWSCLPEFSVTFSCMCVYI